MTLARRCLTDDRIFETSSKRILARFGAGENWKANICQLANPIHIHEQNPEASNQTGNDSYDLDLIFYVFDSLHATAAAEMESIGVGSGSSSGGWWPWLFVTMGDTKYDQQAMIKVKEGRRIFFFF